MANYFDWGRFLDSPTSTSPWDVYGDWGRMLVDEDEEEATEDGLDVYGDWGAALERTTPLGADLAAAGGLPTAAMAEPEQPEPENWMESFAEFVDRGQNKMALPVLWGIQGITGAARGLMGAGEQVSELARETLPLLSSVVTGDWGQVLGDQDLGPGIGVVDEAFDTAGEMFGRSADELSRIEEGFTPQSARGSLVERAANNPVAIPALVAESIIKNAPQLAGAYGATRAVGTGGGLTFAYAQEAGHQYLELIEAGVEEGDAALGAAAVGAVNAALEMAPVERLLKDIDVPLETAKQRLRHWGTQAALESGTEGLQETTASLSSLVQAGIEMNPARIGEAMLVGLFLGGGSAMVTTASAESPQIAQDRASTPTPPQGTPVASPGQQRPLQGPVEAEPGEYGTHAGQEGYSPEAMNRVARRERYVRVRPGGEVISIPNTVDVVDVRAQPGEVVAIQAADGSVRIQDGSPNARQQQALDALRQPTVPAAPRPEVEQEVGEYELTEVGDEQAFLENMGVERLADPWEARVDVPPTESGAVGRRAQQPQLLHRFENPETEARVRKAMHGRPTESLLSRIREGLTTFGHSLSRAHIELAETAGNAELLEVMRRVETYSEVATERAMQGIRESIGHLAPEEYGLFVDATFIRDMSNLLTDRGQDFKLPFGLTAKEIEVEAPKIAQAVAQSPAVQEAIARMDRVWEQTRDRVREAFDGLGLPTQWLDSRGEAYLHHQILERAREDVQSGARLRSPTGRPFQRRIKGSEKDINLSYPEVQGMVLARLETDANVAEQLLRIKRYDISKQVRKAARENELEDWREAIPEGYGLWQPRPGNVFFMAQSLSSTVAQEILEDGLEKLVGKDDLQTILAMGGPRQQWVLPSEWVATLESQGQSIDNRFLRTLLRGNEQLQRAWKFWNILSPTRAPKYLFRNFVGDTQKGFMANPGLYLKRPETIRRAAAELRGWVTRGDLTPKLRDWTDRGGLSAGLHSQEVRESDRERLRRLSQTLDIGAALTDIATSPGKLGSRYMDLARKNARFFESVNRYAMYLDYLQQIERNTTNVPDNYGASIPEVIDALEDPRDKAYWLSNQAIGAYDQVSQLGKFLRSEGMPYWSFQEINIRSHYRLMRNALRSDRVASEVAKKVLGKAAVKAAASPLLVLRAGKFLALASAFELVMKAWNVTVAGDEEEDLPEDVRRQAHITMPFRDFDGNVIHFNRLSVFEEAREWFGLDEFGHGVIEYLNGRMSAKDVATEMLQSPVRQLINAIGPLSAKGVLEWSTRRSTYPDPFQPRYIEDRGEYLAGMWAGRDLYQLATGKPMYTGGSTFTERAGKMVPSWFIYRSEPGAGDYYDALTWKQRFLRSKGRDSGFIPSERTLALRNAKRALKYDQAELATDYLATYFYLGGTPDGMTQSFQTMHPLYGIPKALTSEYMDEWLREDEREGLNDAIAYYYELMEKTDELDVAGAIQLAAEMKQANRGGR